MDVEGEAKEYGEEEEKEEQHRDTNLCITSWRRQFKTEGKYSKNYE